MGIRSFIAKRKKTKSLMISLKKGKPQSSSDVFGGSTKRVQEIIEVFKTFDVNGDGKISLSELGLMMNKLGYTATEDDLKRMVEDVDSDGNGFIDLEEFIQLNTIDSEKQYEDFKLAFSVMDANGDGTVCPEELQKVLRSLGDKVSIEHCEKMIKAVDSDGDGFVSFEEFKKMMIQRLCV